jgi:hypothetical protein
MKRAFVSRWRALRSRTVLVTAARTSLFVGLVLNVVNQRDVWWGGATFSWRATAFNFAVPFLVSAWSAAAGVDATRRA